MKTFLYFRTYPGFSENNLFAKNKFELIDVCVKSMGLCKTLTNAYAVINNSTPEFTEYLNKKFSLIHHVNAPCDRTDSWNSKLVYGGVGSFFRTYEFIMSNNHHEDDIILILEDDYLFVDGGFDEWIAAIGFFDGFVSPYDPPDRYRRSDDAYAKKTSLWLHGSKHWRQIESTTSTIGGKFKYFKKAFFTAKIPRPRIRRFHPGYFFGKELASIDRVFYRRCHYWLGIDLYSPIPALATHLSMDQLSPGVDWEKRFKELER